MVDVVIVSHLGDVHGRMVSLCLQDRGLSVREIRSNEPLGHHGFSLELRPDGQAEVTVDGEPLGPATRVWLRRPFAKRFFDETVVHALDRDFARASAARFYGDVLQALDDTCIAINPLGATLKFESKFCQAQLAHRVGLSVPPTLFTNEPARLTRFASEQRAVCKHFRDFHWEQSGQRFKTAATALGAGVDQAAVSTVEFCPAIVQELLASDEEVRVVCIGEAIFAAGLGWNNEDGARLDWRTEHSKIRPVAMPVPDRVREGLHAFMHASGLRFGAFDFIIRRDQWWFLEVNTAGQWLWMDLPDAGLPILDCFVQYLQNPSAPFVPSQAPLSHRACRARWGAELDTEDPLSPGRIAPVFMAALNSYYGVRRAEEA